MKVPAARPMFALAGMLYVLLMTSAHAETAQDVVKQYQDKFSYSFDLPEQWELVPVNKYQVRIEPVNDRAKVGIAFTVDILHPVFGTAGFDVVKYQKHFLGGLERIGYPTQTAKPFKQLEVAPNWSVTEVKRPGGTGSDLLLFTRNKELAFIFTVAFLDEFDSYFKKYKNDIERIVNNAQIDVE